MRPRFLPCALFVITMALASGCGGSATMSSTSPDPDVAAAKNDLLLAYRVANKARLNGLRCSTGGSPKCPRPTWYPGDRVLQAEVGSDLLHRLSLALAPSIHQVDNPRATYIVSAKTRRRSLVLAQKTDSGTVLVLHGSPSGATFSQFVASDVNSAGKQDRRHLIAEGHQVVDCLHQAGYHKVLRQTHNNTPFLSVRGNGVAAPIVDRSAGPPVVKTGLQSDNGSYVVGIASTQKDAFAFLGVNLGFPGGSTFDGSYDGSIAMISMQAGRRLAGYRADRAKVAACAFSLPGASGHPQVAPKRFR